ncbi:imidazolonepropionase [Brevibacterium otitidis]|uniref:Imidazolonepropionase n=1 Tax=Brevibacterium otitidis TaxID=53364 RepID=A0ABV5X1Z7_9MICO|nr:imidazolonepropionase [Brevibacterium otitidis]
MSTILVTDISELVTNDPSAASAPDGSAAAADDAHPEGYERLGVITDAAMLIEDDTVTWVGPAAKAPAADSAVSADGSAVIPGFVDSHNHLIFAGDRSAEFAARMAGQKYSAGGIATTVAATRAASDAELEDNLVMLMRQAEHSGTTTFEIKTGYGLTLADEIRQLEIINRHTDESTLIAAHVVPPEHKDNPERYVDLVIDEIIPAAAGKAKWIDVFCEEGAFTEDQTARILNAGVAHGMRPRLHANQLTAGGALQLAAAHGCASADHATFASDADLAALAEAGTVATLLPGVEFSTRQPYPDARRFHAAGVTVAIASDCNPGSCFTSSIPFCIALAVRDMHFTVEQAVWSATAGGAAALDRSDIGRLSPGARADFSILTAPSYRHLAYRPGVNLIREVHRAGRPIAANPS